MLIGDIAYLIQQLVFNFMLQVITCTADSADGEIEDSDDDNGDVENLFVTTRSGRLAGNWKLSKHIGKNEYFNINMLVEKIQYVCSTILHCI